MSKYISRKAKLGVSLDELGITLGLSRLPEESNDDYRRRLILHTEVKPDPSEKSFIDTVSRSVGLFEEDIFEIDLVLDADGNPVAPAPRIEVTSCYLRVWSDYPSKAPELEIDIYHRGEGYHLGGVEDKLKALSFITVKVIAETPAVESDSHLYKRSWNLKCGDTDRIAFNKPLKNIRMNRFYHKDETPVKYIHNCLFSSHLIYTEEKTSYESLSAAGDYYIDYTNGIIFSYGIGAGVISYEHRAFPYKLTIQPVKALSPSDIDIEELKKDYLVSDLTGENERLSLNAYGAKITNAILRAYPLQWGTGNE